jgi:hypothetical protein
VADGWRRRGIGSALLARAARLVEPGESLRIINIDASSRPDGAFFADRASRSLPGQFEMVLEFTP